MKILTAADLIAKLSKLDSDAPVMLCSDDPFYRSVGTPQAVTLHRDTSGDITDYAREGSTPFKAIRL